MDYEMTLKNGDFVKLDYTESSDGVFLLATNEETAKEKGIHDPESRYGPRTVILGSGQLVSGLEEDLIGKEVGYSGSIEIPPEKAYGLPDPSKVEMVLINKFKDGKPLPGMRVSMDERLGTVTRVIGRRAAVDFNNPLAGKIVKFDYKILEQIEGQEEKLRAMVESFGRVDLEAKIVGDAAEIVTPWEMSYFKEWFMIRRGLADMIIRTIGLKEVRYIERHTGEPSVTAEMISPPLKTAESGETAPETASLEQQES